MKMVFVTVLAVAMLAGCATMESGTAFDPATAQGFEVGAATRDQVTASLGKPMQTTQNSDGSAVLAYSHIVSSANGFTGKSQATASTAVFVFDAQGVLQRTSFSDPHANGRTN